MVKRFDRSIEIIEVMLALERNISEGNRIATMPLFEEEATLSEIALGGGSRLWRYSLSIAASGTQA